MNLVALLLPLVAPSAPPITIQLRAYETFGAIALNGSHFTKSREDRGNASLIYNPSSPTEEQLEVRVKAGKIRSLGSPVIRTLSGAEGVVKTSQEEIVDGKTITVERSFTVQPLLYKDGIVSVTLGARVNQTGDEPKELLNSYAKFSLREGKTVYFLAPMKQDSNRSLLVSVRVSTGS